MQLAKEPSSPLAHLITSYTPNSDNNSDQNLVCNSYHIYYYTRGIRLTDPIVNMRESAHSDLLVVVSFLDEETSLHYVQDIFSFRPESGKALRDLGIEVIWTL